MNILLIKIFFVGFMVSEIPRVSVFGYFPLCILKLIKIITLSVRHCTPYGVYTAYGTPYIYIFIYI